MKKAKYSQNFERDWTFYTKNMGRFSFWGGDAIFEPKFSSDGLSPKEFFHKLDSLGVEKMKDKTCSEPKVVSDVLLFKKALNFHIKLWAEGYDDCGMGIKEYLDLLDEPPEWVETSFRNQVYKVFDEKKASGAYETKDKEETEISD